MLAQITLDNAGTWTAATAFVSMLLVQIGKMIADSRKDRRDRQTDEAKQKSLERIANATEAALLAQVEVKSVLYSQDKINQLRHEALLERLKVTCPLMKNL